MSKAIFHNFSDGPAKVAPFSHAVECDGWIQLTGQMPTDPRDIARPLPVGIEAQTRQALENLATVLERLGLGFENILSCRVYLTEFGRDYDRMNAVYRGYFPGDRLPARTCIGVTGLARGALVEIDAVARRPG